MKKKHNIKLRVFVTGGTGFIGSAVVQELLNAGHQVVGLARSDEAANSLVATGARAIRGNLEDFDALRCGAGPADAVIHTAFIHDLTNFEANCETDRLAIEAIGAALANCSQCPLIVTSAIGLLPPGRVALEEHAPLLGPNATPRVASEVAAASVAARGVRVSVVRLPLSVHGEGDHGFIPALVAIARERGVSAFVGDGLNRWPSVHRLDAASLYRQALEKSSEDATYHAVADEGVPFRDIAGVIGRRLNVPVASIPAEEAAGHFDDWLAHFVALDIPASSAQTRELLGWQPTQPGLIADLDSESYFASSFADNLRQAA